VPLALHAVLAAVLAGSLEAVLEDELRQTGTPGAAVVVIENARPVLARGFGVEAGAPVSVDTVFPVGSVTKTVTAAAALALVDDGRLRLEDHVGRWVSGLPEPIASITVHELLAQTSGLADEPADDEGGGIESYVRSWTAEHVILGPGRAFSYSNPGYALLGLVLQRAAGKPYADVVAERVLRPLGMSRSTLGRGDARFGPAGSLRTTAADLGRFVAWLFDARAMTVRRTSFPPVFDGDGYGYGLFVDDARPVRVFGHGGQMPGFTALVRLVPARRAALVLLANREGVRFEKTVGRFLDDHAGAPVAAASPSPIAMTPDEMARYVGTYRNRWSMDVAVVDGRLVLRWAGADRPLTRIGADAFSITGPGGPVTLRVVESAGGTVEGLQMFVWTFARLGPVGTATGADRPDASRSGPAVARSPRRR
jgi:CubicO group peptidase (beta-lactamase class C family)